MRVFGAKGDCGSGFALVADRRIIWWASIGVVSRALRPLVGGCGLLLIVAVDDFLKLGKAGTCSRLKAFTAFYIKISC